jgi:hypothetical protein
LQLALLHEHGARPEDLAALRAIRPALADAFAEPLDGPAVTALCAPRAKPLKQAPGEATTAALHLWRVQQLRAAGRTADAAYYAAHARMPLLGMRLLVETGAPALAVSLFEERTDEARKRLREPLLQLLVAHERGLGSAVRLLLVEGHDFRALELALPHYRQVDAGGDGAPPSLAVLALWSTAAALQKGELREAIATAECNMTPDMARASLLPIAITFHAHYYDSYKAIDKLLKGASLYARLQVLTPFSTT